MSVKSDEKVVLLYLVFDNVKIWQNRIDIIMNNDKKKLELSGAELVSLAGSLAICFAQKYEGADLRRLRLFFQAIASNIATIEIEGLYRKDRFDK